MNMYQPMYGMNMEAMAAEQAALQQRIQQMEHQRQQYQYPAQTAPVQNVNWIQVAGLEGAKNQIVQPGQTTWMMDNNSPVFYVKSVDGMGSATLKAFQFQEIPLNAPAPASSLPEDLSGKYVTREEYNALLERLGEKVEDKNEGGTL